MGSVAGGRGGSSVAGGRGGSSVAGGTGGSHLSKAGGTGDSSSCSSSTSVREAARFLVACGGGCSLGLPEKVR
jgi:hypothetical protein